METRGDFILSKGNECLTEASLSHHCNASYSAVLNIRETGNSYFCGEKESPACHGRETGSELLHCSKQRVRALRFWGYVLLLQQKRRLWEH